MKLPETICVGYQDIEIVETDFPCGEQGVYIPEKSQIRIQKDLSAREVVNTVIHECLHAIFHVYGAKALVNGDEQEEKLVNVIGNGFAEIFSRNPDLVKWVAHYAQR